MDWKFEDRNMERICRREEHEKVDRSELYGTNGRREENGRNMKEIGTWKGNLEERNMERKCRREEHGKEIKKRGTWSGR